jgi:hypothetical protein
MTAEFQEYEVVLVDPYFDDRRVETVEAICLSDAIDRALQLAGDDLHVDEVSSADGEVTCFSGPEYEVVQATGLIRYASGDVEDWVPSLTFRMALDLLEAMHAEGTVMAVRARSTLTWTCDMQSSKTLPTGWRPYCS